MLETAREESSEQEKGKRLLGKKTDSHLVIPGTSFPQEVKAGEVQYLESCITMVQSSLQTSPQES